MRAHDVHVLWQYTGEMQVSFGVYATVNEASTAWKQIRDDGFYIAASGEISEFITDDFAPGSWSIESYTPGRVPQETML
ncbi:hypothetical protein ACFVU2_15185 [Leifsonia sp. NPDC058194]|uniref:hypothetical protein n=1 Tax=Leifsonia sp. NPDC058194 TaxID=3346374 RepID=UPI0036DA0EBA